MLINLNFLPARGFATTGASLHVRCSYVTLPLSDSLPLPISFLFLYSLSYLFIFVSVGICVNLFFLFSFFPYLFVCLSVSLSLSIYLSLYRSFLFTFSCYSSFNTETENLKYRDNSSSMKNINEKNTAAKEKSRYDDRKAQTI